MDRFGFSDAQLSCIFTEITQILTVNDTDTAPHKQVVRNGKAFPYCELVGSLMYLATCTRPDLVNVVAQLGRYVQCPTQQHIGAAKRVLRYFVGTKRQDIVYTKTSPPEQNDTQLNDGYCGSDCGNNPDKRKVSLDMYMVWMEVQCHVRHDDKQVLLNLLWRQTCEDCMEDQGLRNLLIEVFPAMEAKLRQGTDNQGAFVMSNNPTYSRRARHTELRWHYKVKTDNNPSDLMTQSLSSDRFEMLSEMIGLTKANISKDVPSEGSYFKKGNKDRGRLRDNR
ncbi:Copiatype Polyprotein [Phytophthora palmivora]|uniref:Copiatype Polyprotein n=1 Tax=Phytophthora palmivora TaxID=4796 RepID=A0A2P4X3G3_9STRA|nr:Copiatype Polyprotein [Phytophthora palmivora]